MPDIKTVIGWAMDRSHDFYPQYKDARIKQAELRIDEIDDLAKSALQFVKTGSNGECVDPAAVAAIRLLVDVRKWSAAKMMPKVYGMQEESEEKQRFIPLSELAERLRHEPIDD